MDPQLLKEIADALPKESLSPRERLEIRGNLLSFMSDHPARMRMIYRFLVWLSKEGSGRHFYSGARAGVVAFLLVLVVGVGTSSAAVGSLPGNPLYPIKVAFDEPIERATVASGESQTQWDVTLASRRLEEAERLAVQRNLTPQNERTIQDQLDAVSQNFNSAVSVIATSSSDAALAVSNTQSNFEAALSAHSQILAAIASSSPEVDSQIAPILSAIRTRDQKAHNDRIAAAAQVLNTSSSTSAALAAGGEKQAAVSALSNIQALAEGAGIPNPSAIAAITLDASATEEAIQEGDDNLASGNFREAFKAFQAATLSAQEAQVRAQAQQQLSGDIATPVLSASSTDATQSQESQSITDATSTASTTPTLISTSTTDDTSTTTIPTQ